MAAGDLTDVATVKSLGEVAGAQKDALIATLITAASSFISDLTDRSFAAPLAHTDIVHGTGGDELFLRFGPAISIQSLTIDTHAIPAQPADGQPGYFLAGDGRVLCLSGYEFTRGRRNVRVAYTEGNGAIPPDVAIACAEIVLSVMQRGKRGEEVSGQNVEGQNFTFSLQDIPASARSTLQRYSRVAPA